MSFYFIHGHLQLYHLNNCLFRSVGGKLVDSTPELEKEMDQELEKAAKQYGGGPGTNMAKFPTFKFKGDFFLI